MNLHFRQRIMGLVLLAILLASSGAPGSATCASGSPADYADIGAVMLKQTGCGLTLHRRKVSTFDCSMFYAFFWGPPVNDSQYAQYNLGDSVGTYRLRTGLQRVVRVLKQDNFFALSPPDFMATDTAESVLTVKRCAVVTRIRVYNVTGNSVIRLDAATRRLFDDLRHLIDQSAKTRVSSEPTDFKETLLFDP